MVSKLISLWKINFQNSFYASLEIIWKYKQNNGQTNLLGITGPQFYQPLNKSTNMQKVCCIFNLILNTLYFKKLKANSK